MIVECCLPLLNIGVSKNQQFLLQLRLKKTFTPFFAPSDRVLLTQMTTSTVTVRGLPSRMHSLISLLTKLWQVTNYCELVLKVSHNTL